MTEKRNRATGRLYGTLSARSDSEADAGSVLLVSAADQLLAVPLTWHATEGYAGGALGLGSLSGRLKLAVVTEVVAAGVALDAELLSRSLHRAVDARTREALNRLLERL